MDVIAKYQKPQPWVHVDATIGHTDPSFFVKEKYLKNLPDFAHLIFTDLYVSDEDKIKFKNKILMPYLKDENFKKEHENFYIIFANYKLIGIFLYPFFENINTKNSITGVKIEEHPEKREMYYVSQSIVNIKTKYASEVNDPATYHLGRIQLGIDFGNDCHLKENRLIDTGASTSTIFYMNKWSFNEIKWKEDETYGSGKYSITGKILNELVAAKIATTMGTGAGATPYFIIKFKKPVEISVDNLPPLLILEMSVPKYYHEPLDILGADIIFKHTVIISSSNMNMDIKFLPSEQNNYSTDTRDNYRETIFGQLAGNFAKLLS